jgi:hypothetical protein
VITKEKHRIRCFSFTEGKTFAITAGHDAAGAQRGHRAARRPGRPRDHPPQPTTEFAPEPNSARTTGADLLAAELLTASPDYVYTDLGGRPFGTGTAVGVLKPPPSELLGTVVGQLAVEDGLLTVCQFPLADTAREGDPLALALIEDLLCWSQPRDRAR